MSEAARYLGCSVSSIRNYTKSKGKYNLPCVRTIGQHRKIRQLDLDAFISKFSDISNKTNTLTADEQGFGDDESERELTYKSIKFGLDGTPSGELFRQHDEKVKAKDTIIR
jgi:excisionase family DNA binding protein